MLPVAAFGPTSRKLIYLPVGQLAVGGPDLVGSVDSTGTRRPAARALLDDRLGAVFALFDRLSVIPTPTSKCTGTTLGVNQVSKLCDVTVD